MSGTTENDSIFERLIWQQYLKAGGLPDGNGSTFKPTFDSLARKAEYLYRTNRHPWVRKRLAALPDFPNWHAYEMEVHFTHALETHSKPVQNGVRRIPNENSDIDIVYSHTNGIEIRAECMYIRTPEKYWTEEEIAPGLTVQSAFYMGDEALFPSRMAQSKIRYKTISDDGRPIKFPPQECTAVHLIVCDITNGLGGYPPKYVDLQLLTEGRKAFREGAKRDLLGLFEPQNLYGSKFDAEFAGNLYLRERIHCILFLMDKSSWRSSLDPKYTCCLMVNTLLKLESNQVEALISFLKPLSKIIPKMLTGEKQVENQDAT